MLSHFSTVEYWIYVFHKRAFSCMRPLLSLAAPWLPLCPALDDSSCNVFLLFHSCCPISGGQSVLLRVHTCVGWPDPSWRFQHSNVSPERGGCFSVVRPFFRRMLGRCHQHILLLNRRFLLSSVPSWHFTTNKSPFPAQSRDPLYWDGNPVSAFPFRLEQIGFTENRE